MEAQSLLKKTVLAGIGVYSMTKERAQGIIDELVKKGELSQEEGPRFVKAMVQKAEEEVDYLKEMIDSRISKTMSAMRPSYHEEFKKINQRLDKLSKEVSKLSKQ